MGSLDRVAAQSWGRYYFLRKIWNISEMFRIIGKVYAKKMKRENFTIDGLEVAGGSFTVSATVTFSWSQFREETRLNPSEGGELSFNVEAVEIIEASEGHDPFEPSTTLEITQQMADPTECYFGELWAEVESRVEAQLNERGMAA